MQVFSGADILFIQFRIVRLPACAAFGNKASGHGIRFCQANAERGGISFILQQMRNIDVMAFKIIDAKLSVGVVADDTHYAAIGAQSGCRH